MKFRIILKTFDLSAKSEKSIKKVIKKTEKNDKKKKSRHAHASTQTA